MKNLTCICSFLRVFKLCLFLTGPPQENMANPKEKTPMCLVNELARFNRIQPQYKLLNENGPAHAKVLLMKNCDKGYCSFLIKFIDLS